MTWWMWAIAAGVVLMVGTGAVVIGRVLLDEERAERACEIRRDMQSID